MTLRNKKKPQESTSNDEFDVDEFIKTLYDLESCDEPSKILDKVVAISIGTTAGICISLWSNRRTLKRRVDKLEERVSELEK